MAEWANLAISKRLTAENCRLNKKSMKTALKRRAIFNNPTRPNICLWVGGCNSGTARCNVSHGMRTGFNTPSFSTPVYTSLITNSMKFIDLHNRKPLPGSMAPKALGVQSV